MGEGISTESSHNFSEKSSCGSLLVLLSNKRGDRVVANLILNETTARSTTFIFNDISGR